MSAEHTLCDVVVLCGASLEPWRCTRFSWKGDTITALDRKEKVTVLEKGSLVIIPGLYNSHTHMGDSCLPDGATGLTLEQGFFRPNGFKYRKLAAMSREEHLPHVVNHLRYMARTGTVGHIDFREQGPYGSELLREASNITGIDSVILGQFSGVPFDEKALGENSAGFPADSMDELEAILAVADGFSESTMNDLTDVAWGQVRELTNRLGKMRAIHCLENDGYRDLSFDRTGRGDLVRAIELYDPHLIVHMTVAAAAEIGLLVRSGKTAALNPRANANLGLPMPPVAALMEAGANLVLGTDNGLLNSPSILAELDFTYKLAKSQYGDALRPDPLAILRMATSNVAAVLGKDRCGALEKGLPATFVVLDFHKPHLRSTQHIPASIVTRVTPEDVIGTYRMGNPLYKAAELNPSN
ncbi:MAG TPA: amidohydrolase family protein [Opitutaceae bacterium]|jgi:cytosine/adenosine deaminase-related metal-dependent hydrolase|nr:amidohydrolase family protein [Opitutaceae bacterium]